MPLSEPWVIDLFSLGVACGVLVPAMRSWLWVQHTTLRSTWFWCATALGFLLADLWFSARHGFPLGHEERHYLVRILALCPVISLLGAKRPQEGAWNFVVLALWGALALPAAVSFAQREVWHVPLGWSLMIAALIFLGSVNLLPAHPFTALLATAGLVWLHAGSIWLHPGTVWLGSAAAAWSHVGTLLLVLAALVWSPQNRLDETATPERSDGLSGIGTLNRIWLDFRRLYGTFWALRVQELMNEAAERHSWPVRLAWNGWEPLTTHETPNSLPTDVHRHIQTVLRGFLRRFVQHAWIDARL
jgi:hypothetical protein